MCGDQMDKCTAEVKDEEEVCIVWGCVKTDGYTAHLASFFTKLVFPALLRTSLFECTKSCS